MSVLSPMIMIVLSLFNGHECVVSNDHDCDMSPFNDHVVSVLRLRCLHWMIMILNVMSPFNNHDYVVSFQ